MHANPPARPSVIQNSCLYADPPVHPPSLSLMARPSARHPERFLVNLPSTQFFELAPPVSPHICRGWVGGGGFRHREFCPWGISRQPAFHSLLSQPASCPPARPSARRITDLVACQLTHMSEDQSSCLPTYTPTYSTHPLADTRPPAERSTNRSVRQPALRHTHLPNCLSTSIPAPASILSGGVLAKTRRKVLSRRGSVR